MPRHASGKERIERIIAKQKNGDRYVYERKSRYNPEKKYYVSVCSKLIGKMKQGSDDKYDLIPTRPKADSKRTIYSENKSVLDSNLTFRARTGMMDIVRFISEKSGVTSELIKAIPDDEGLRKKTETLAWYNFSTDGATWPGVKAWSVRYIGLLPYTFNPISQDMYHEVFYTIGLNESIKQIVFANRAAALTDGDLVALDSSTTVTVSVRNQVGRKGVHKDGVIRKLYKVVYIYSIDLRKPIAYAILPGNIPDSLTVSNAIKQIKAITDKKIQLVEDAGYCNEETIAIMLKENQSFLTRIPADTKWINELVEKHRETIEHGGEFIKCDAKFSGVCDQVTRVFSAKKKKGQEPFDIEGTLNVFIYFSSVNKSKDDVEFRTTFQSYSEDLISEKSLCDDRKKIEDFANKYMNIVRDNNGKITSISVKTKEYDKKLKYSGYLVLISNSETDTNNALLKFRIREYIEELVKNHKSHGEGDSGRVWDNITLDGKVFVDFLGITLHETFESKIRSIKNRLALVTGDAEHDTTEVLKQERKLKNWLERTSLHNILKWFDTVEYVNVAGLNEAVKWTTECTERDRMFIEQLGMNSDDFGMISYETE